MLDTYLDHQTLLLMARTDATVFTQEPIFQRFMRLPIRAVEIMVGPDAKLADRVNGRRVGRPRALTAAKVTRAREMYNGGSHSVDEIATELGVSRATVYRYLG
jgi:hypothetical protein